MTGPSLFDRWTTIAAAILACAAVAVVLLGCDDARGSNPEGGPTHEVGSTLVSVGLYFTYAGSAALGLGFLGVVACFVMPAIAGFRELLSDIAVIGLASILLGSSFIWLGNHAWLLAVAVGLLCAFLLYRYWPRIVRFARRKKAEAVK